MDCCRRHLIDDFSIEGEGVRITVGEAVHTLSGRHATEYVAWLLEQEHAPRLHNPDEVLTQPPDAADSSAAAPGDDA